MFENLPDLEPPKVVTRYDRAAERMRNNPGVWHKWGSVPSLATTNVENGILTAFRPAGAFQARRQDGLLLIRCIEGTVICPACEGTGSPHRIDDIGWPCATCSGNGRIVEVTA